MLLAGLSSLFIGLVLQPFAIYALRRRGALDLPTARSSHDTATPRGGGAVVTLALVAGVLTAGGLEAESAVVVVAIALCASVGLVEDLVGVAVVPRFVLLLLAVGPLAFLTAGDGALRIACLALTVLFAVAVVNATNFMDGINGISIAQSTAAGGAYALLAHSQGHTAVALVAGAVVGAALSFTPFNVPRARVFLGDSGSYGLGAAMAGLCVALLAEGLPFEAALAPLAIYLADSGTTLARRVITGQPWREPHRSHVYQRLTDCGLTHVQVSSIVLVFVITCSALGSGSLAGSDARVLSGLGLVLVVSGYLNLPRLLHRRVSP